MLKFKNSGLSQAEVMRLRAVHEREVRKPEQMLLIPELALALAFAILAGLAFGIVPGVIVFGIGGILSVRTFTKLHTLARLMTSENLNVMTVRGGLLRRVQVCDLVVGDVIMTTPGQVLPVDVQIADEFVGAGTPLTYEAIAKVLAIGAATDVAKQLAITGRAFKPAELRALFKAATVADRLELPVLNQIVHVPAEAIQQAFLQLPTALKDVATGMLETRRPLLAFLANQGTVSWPRAV